MSDKKYSENDPERTLITLDQLSQTIEVMTSVVNRLRQHLNDQIAHRRDIEELQQAHRERLSNGDTSAGDDCEPALRSDSQQTERRGVVVEVSRPEQELEEAGEEKTLH